MGITICMGSDAPIQTKVAIYSTEFLEFITLFFVLALILGTFSNNVSGDSSKFATFDGELIPHAGAQSNETEGDGTIGIEGDEDETKGDEDETKGDEDETKGDEDETKGDEDENKITRTAEVRIAKVLTIDSVNPESPIAGIDNVRIEGRTSTSLGFIEVDWGDQKVEREIRISSDSGYGKWSAEHTYGDSSVGERQIVVKWWNRDVDQSSINDVKFHTVNVGSPSVSHPTNIEIKPILEANSNGPITVEGSLTDDETDEGIANMEITFDGSGTGGLSSVTTNEEGSFLAEGTAPDTVDTGWEVQAHFAGVSNYEASESNVETYDTKEATLYKTTLELESISDVPVSGPITVEGSLTDDETDEGIANMEITFDGSGTGGLSSVTTNEEGSFLAEGTAPDTVDTGWEVQAHFAGKSEYEAADSQPESYGTQPQSTTDPNPTLDSPELNQGSLDVNPELPVVPEPEPEFASPDNPSPPEPPPQSWSTDLLIIAGLAIAAAVVVVALTLAKIKSNKDNLELDKDKPEVVDEVIIRGGTER